MIIIQIFYITIFGRHNIIIGIILGLAAVGFIKRDFTGQILYRTITFLIINLYLAIAAYFATTNIYIGLVINFITIFMVTYVYMNDYKHPTSYTFLMAYIFMVCMKINIDELPLRLLAVSMGVIFIILPQIILNRKQFEKKSTNIIKNIVKEILEQIDDLIDGKYEEGKSIKINQKIRSLVICINERINNSFKKNKHKVNMFNIAICLSRLNIIINHISKCKMDKDKRDEYLNDLKLQIINIDKFNDGLNSFEIINKNIDDFANRYKKLGKKINLVDESIYVLKIFLKRISVNEEYDNTISSKVYKTVNMPKRFNMVESMKENFNIKSLRCRYSIKLAMAISILIFLGNIINIEHKAWVIISAYIVLQPYQEDGVVKAKKRFIGVTKGVLIFFITFSLIKDYVPIIVILLFTFTGYFYFTDYSKKVIMTTILSLSSISLVENIDKTSLSRFAFVSIGIGIGLLFNQYFLPYQIEDSIKELKHKYKKNTKAILKEIHLIMEDKHDTGKLMSLSMERNKIENKLILNYNKLNKKDLEKFVYEENMKMSDEKYTLLKHFYKNSNIK